MLTEKEKIAEKERIEKKKEVLLQFQKEFSAYLIKNEKKPIFTNGGLNITLYLRESAMFGLSHNDIEILKFNFFEKERTYHFNKGGNNKYFDKLDNELKNKTQIDTRRTNYGISEFIRETMRKYDFKEV